MPQYQIKQGDTLSEIAQRKGTTVQKLREENPGVDPRRLQVGQTLNLPYDGKQSGQGGRQGQATTASPPRNMGDRGRPGRPTGGDEGLTGLLQDAVESVGMAALTMQGGKQRLAQDLQEGGIEEAKSSIKEMWFNALDESHEKYSPDSVKGDAYRHYEGSRRTAQKYGPMTSLAVGTQHELKNAMEFVQGEYGDDFSVGDLLAASGQDMVNNIRGVIDGTLGRERASPGSLSTMDRTYKGR